METIVHILHQSSLRWRCAVRALSVLRSMAEKFKIELSPVPDLFGAPPSERHWLRALPRKPRDSEVTPVAGGSGTSISDESWLQRMASGNDSFGHDDFLTSSAGPAWSCLDYQHFSASASALAPNFGLTPQIDFSLPMQPLVSGGENRDEEETKMLFEEFGIGLAAGPDSTMQKDSLDALLGDWEIE